MKDLFSRLLDRPTYLLLLIGVGAVILASANITLKDQSIAVADPFWRNVLAGVGIPLILLSVAFIVRDLISARPGSPLKLKYDVFIASPMASLEGPAYAAQRTEIEGIKDALMANSGISKIYDAGAKLQQDKWDPTVVAAEDDLEALRHSRYFLLVYPERIASSVLFEAGYALGLGKSAVYIVRQAKSLPFLMQELDNLSRTYPQIKIWECPDTAAIVERVRQTGRRMFTSDVAPPEC